jgi:hypothetical protein
MAYVYQDNFNRTNTTGPEGLGSVSEPSGGPAWEYVSGSWYINDNKAVSGTPRYENPIAVLTGNSDGTIEVDTSSEGGDCLYYRVIDSLNWWRTRIRKFQVSYEETEYEWRDDYTGWTDNHSHADGTGHGATDDTYLVGWGTYSTPPSFPNTVSHANGATHTHSTGAEGPYKTGATRVVTKWETYRRVHVEHSVAGTISGAGWTGKTATRLKVVLSGDQLKHYVNDEINPWFTQTSTVHQEASRHGIGRGESEHGGTSLDNFYASFEQLAPYAPTLLYPIGGQSIVIDQSNVLDWTFNDPDSGDTQTRSVGEIRTTTGVAAYSWDTESSSERHTLAAGELAAGNYEWRVKTYDSQGSAGPWSDWEAFTGLATPGAPTLITPTNNSVIPTEQYLVEWSTSSQEAYEGQRVADNAGVINTSTVYWHSGVVAVSTTRTQYVNFSINGRFEWVRWRIRRDGLWSPWAEVRVEVSYTLPAVPTVDLLFEEASASVKVLIGNPSPTLTGEPLVEYNDIYRRVLGESTWLLRASGVARNGSWTDHEVGSQHTYEYYVRAQGDNETSSSSQIASQQVTYDVWWLKNPADPTVNTKIEPEGDELSITTPREATTFRPQGRKNAVVVYGAVQSDEFSLELGTISVLEYNSIKTLWELNVTLLLLSPYGEYWYVRFNGPKETRVLNTRDPWRKTTLSFVEVGED